MSEKCIFLKISEKVFFTSGTCLDSFLLPGFKQLDIRGPRDTCEFTFYESFLVLVIPKQSQLRWKI